MLNFKDIGDCEEVYNNSVFIGYITKNTMGHVFSPQNGHPWPVKGSCSEVRKQLKGYYEYGN